MEYCIKKKYYLCPIMFGTFCMKFIYKFINYDGTTQLLIKKRIKNLKFPQQFKKIS